MLFLVDVKPKFPSVLLGEESLKRIFLYSSVSVATEMHGTLCVSYILYCTVCIVSHSAF